MIAIDSITEQELDKRFEKLSSKLKEALVSERNLSVVDQICEKNKIAEGDKITTIHQLVGLTILGLIHSYDLGTEINDSLSLENPKFSAAIAEELNAKVFLPIKVELESNYHPVVAAHLDQKNTPTNIPLNGPLMSGAKIPTISSITPHPPATDSTVPKMVANSAPKPTTLSDVGWSRSSSAGPGIKLSAAPATPQPPQASSSPAPIPTPSAPKEPAPVMLHEDTSFKAVEKNSGFTLSRPGAGADVHIGQGGPAIPTTPKPAVLEFGGVPKPPATVKQNNTPQSGAVHYSDFKVSLSTMPTVSSGPRNVNQVVPPTPPAPAKIPPPAPPTLNAVPVPRPPQTPQPLKPPQNNKPIVKDFL